MMYVIQTLMLYIMCAQLLSHVQLSDPIDSRLLGSYVDGISQERILSAGELMLLNCGAGEDS